MYNCRLFFINYIETWIDFLLFRPIAEVNRVGFWIDFKWNFLPVTNNNSKIKNKMYQNDTK